MPPIPDLADLTPEQWDRLVALIFGPPEPTEADLLEEQVLEGQQLLEELTAPPSSWSPGRASQPAGT